MLTDAMMDLKREVVAGNSAEEVAASVAADYGVNAALLLRKFRDSYKTDDGLRATVAGTTEAAVMPGKVQRELERVCRHYQVSPDGCRETTWRGKRYSVVGRLPRGRLVAVCHQDARAYRLPA
jgi:hypothetical protein